MRSTTAAHPRALPLIAVIAAAFLATAALLVSTAAVRAGIQPVCSVLVSSVSSPVPAETATVFVGEQGTTAGSGFSPDTELTIDITVNGVPQVTFALTTDGSGAFILTGPIEPWQLGVLVLTATEPDGCSDSITANILAAPTPPEGLPDAAMEPLAPTPASGGGAALAFAALLAAAIGWSAVLELRYRQRTR